MLPAVCPNCGSTDFTIRKVIKEEDDTTGNGFTLWNRRFRRVVWKDTVCKRCDQRIVARYPEDEILA